MEQAESYPLAAYNFRVEVDGITMRFSKVSGLAHEYQTRTYRDGLSFLDGERIVKFFVDAYKTITLEQGVVHHDHDLHEWLASAKARQVDVQLCDATGRPVLAWRIRKAVAVKLSAPTLTASGNELAIASLELMAAGISIEDLG